MLISTTDKEELKPLTYEELKENNLKRIERENEVQGDLNRVDGIDCPLCKNRGYIYVASDNGITMEVKKCECMQKRNSFRFIKHSGMDKLLNHKINNYETTEEWQKAVKSLALDYVTSNSRNWFTFLGHSGIGKTHICSAIANNYLKNLGIEVKYIVWSDFITSTRDFERKEDAVEEIKRVPVLYIDDLFKGRVTDWQKDIAFKLINYRYNNDLVTIISSELVYEELAEQDEAIASRIYDKSGKYFIEIENGANYRLYGGR